MEIKDLFKGVAVVIDDEVNDETANISKIVSQIENESIPVLRFEEIPQNSDDLVRHFTNLSFLLFDWRLIKNEIGSEELAEGVKLPDELEKDDIKENIVFLEKLNEVCFCPIFIFTNEDIEEVQTALEASQLYFKGKPSNIFIKGKSDLQKDGSFFKVIEDWLKDTPSVYVLKEWEKEYAICKTKLFSDFQEISSVWPYVMWKNFEVDGANKSVELGELISRNLYSRMSPFEFDNDVLNGDYSSIKQTELRQVLEGERYLSCENLHENDICTGDVYKEEANGEEECRYLINIRAQCDLLRDENPDLYCLCGHELEQNEGGKIKDISFYQGQYIEKVKHAIVAFIDGGKIIEFSFSNLRIKSWQELKNKRIGRLLSPYINKIQQRYSLYMQRQGLPRIPEEAIFPQKKALQGRSKNLQEKRNKKS